MPGSDLDQQQASDLLLSRDNHETSPARQMR
jgi:hypothetical protein